MWWKVHQCHRPFVLLARSLLQHWAKHLEGWVTKRWKSNWRVLSSDNLSAKGGFGAVYKGALRDGQVVAVKHHKVMSACAQAAFQFISEDEILSCAQHRSLVVLVGYCIEIVWLLVYGYPCNGSSDDNLCGPN